jgi:glycosyltransferase involved in cell wall biosynthesis
MSTLIIVVPCFNEAGRLRPEAYLAYARRRPNVRFLMVNDGSTDGTLAVLRRMAESDHRRFDVLDLADNCGKAEAVRQGMLHALRQEADWVGFWDADLATPLEAIDDFQYAADARPGLRAVIGTRLRLLGHRIERPFARRVLGRAFATAASRVLGIAIHDTQCGAKLFRSDAATAALFAEPFRARWVFDVELLARLVRQAARQNQPADQVIYELPLAEWRDVAGSKLKASDFPTALLDLARIGWAYRSGKADAAAEDARHVLPRAVARRKQRAA